MPQDSIVGELIKNLGLTGNTLAVSSLVAPNPNNPNSRERLEKDFQNASKISDPDIWAEYSNLTRRPTTFEQMLKLWEEMSSWDLMAAALVEMVDEACQTDDTYPKAMWYECNDTGVENDLNEMLEVVDAESIIPSQIWHLSGFGNSFDKVQYNKGEGVMGLRFVHPMEMRRYWLERNRACIGFRWMSDKPDHSDVYTTPTGDPIPRVQIGDNSKTAEDLWYPWDFMHARRMYRMRFTEHGEPVFDEAQGIYKKLRVALDQMVVHRAQIQPDRYVVNIDTQELPPAEQMKAVQRWKQTLRSKLSFGTGDSSTPYEFKSFYNAMSLDTILWVAKPKGYEHSIVKLNGTPTVPDVYDIELLENLFFSILGMPKWWVMGAKDGGNAPSGKALLATDIRFLRKVKSVRKPLIQAYEWLGYFHAALKGKPVDQLTIKAHMPPIGSLEDQMRVDILKSQIEVLDGLSDVMAKYQLPREAWIEVVFKKYMHMPDDVINVFMTALPEEPVEQEEGRKPAPRMGKILSEIDDTLKRKGLSRPPFSEKGLEESLARQVARKPKKYNNWQEVFGVPYKSGQTVGKLLTEGELVRSSYQNNETPLKEMGGSINESTAKNEAWRKFIPVK